MRASNKGAYSVDPKLSKGITVSFLNESHNKYLNENIVTHNFQDRKDLLNKNKVGYVFCPGGMGTLDEFTELLNLYIKLNSTVPLLNAVFAELIGNS